MHDPNVVAFEIRRPWPTRSGMPAKPGQPRWRARYPGATWWRPWAGWRPFWTIAGRSYYWPPLVTVWHREPGGRDSLTVCGRGSDGQRAAGRRWRWHIHHWRIQIRPLQRLRRWLFERCELCGHRYPYGYAPVAHQWNQPAGRWWRVQRRAYHHECSSLVHVRRQLADTEDVVRRLAAEIRVRTDEDETALVERLASYTNHSWDQHLRWRLERILGYERDNDYRLVRSGAGGGRRG